MRHFAAIREAVSIATVASCMLASATCNAATLTPNEASQHVGENATVCGLVASATYAVQSRGQPTFLNLGKPYPNQVFTAVIWGNDRAKFGMPEQLRSKEVCATGDIRLYRGKPEIIVHDPAQLKTK
jgi:hypothetical protein